MTEDERNSLERDAGVAAASIGGALTQLLASTWDNGRFIVKGQAVAITTIRKLLARIEKRQGQRMVRLADDLDAQRITADEWQREMKRVIDSAHVLSAALALGSIAQAVKDVDVQARIASEWAYFDNFAAEVRK